MAQPTTSVGVCNLALDRLGQRPISSITTPTTDVEDVCARHYDQTRRKLLRQFIFNFAKKYDTLTASTTKTPAFGFATAYDLPNDFIRLLALGDITINNDVAANLYDLSEGYIFTDSGDSGSLNITYIYNATTVTKFDPLFLDVLVLQLAQDMAYKFTLKPSLITGIRDDLRDLTIAALAVSGQEKPPRRIERSRLRDVRRRGGYTRDPRYV